MYVSTIVATAVPHLSGCPEHTTNIASFSHDSLSDPPPRHEPMKCRRHFLAISAPQERGSGEAKCLPSKDEAGCPEVLADSSSFNLPATCSSTIGFASVPPPATAEDALAACEEIRQALSAEAAAASCIGIVPNGEPVFTSAIFFNNDASVLCDLYSFAACPTAYVPLIIDGATLATSLCGCDAPTVLAPSFPA